MRTISFAFCCICIWLIGCHTEADLVPGVTVQSVAPGIHYEQYNLPGPVVAHLVKVDLKDSSAVAKVALAQDMHQGGRAATSLLAQQAGAIIAINGDYFANVGPSQGFVVIDGEMVVGPAKRTAFGWTKDGKPQIERYILEGTAYVQAQDGAKYNLFYNRVNMHDFGPGEMGIYTPRMKRTPTSKEPTVQYRFCALEGTEWKGSTLIGTVKAVSTEPRDIPSDQFVIGTTNGDSREASEWATQHLTLNSKVTVHLTTTPPWEHLHGAIGGGPRLVRDGQNVVDAATVDRTMADEIGVALARDGQPRSAVGYTKDQQTLLLCVIEGRVSQSVGMTPAELAEFLTGHEAYQAMMLDGGGSSTLWVKGRNVVNRLGTRSGAERPVANALCIVPKTK